MFTSEELGVERLSVGDFVYRFEWDKPLMQQVCMGRISKIVITKDIREGYIVENIYDNCQFDVDKIYTRMDIEKSPEEESWVVTQHLNDLSSYLTKRYFRNRQ